MSDNEEKEADWNSWPVPVKSLSIGLWQVVKWDYPYCTYCQAYHDPEEPCAA